MATYNGADYIKVQIDSILKQTYQDFKIIIRDDGSKDETVNIIKEYEKRYPDKVKLVCDNVKCGSSVSNFFQLIKYATGEYVMFADQDDFWLPHKVEFTYGKMMEIEKNIGKDKPVLVFADYKVVDNSLTEIEFNQKRNQIAAYNLDFNRLLVQNYVTGCLAMVNKSLYKNMGDYNRTILMHDWWAALYASAKGEIVHFAEPVMLYRQHGDNCVGAVDVKSFKYRFQKFFDKDTKKAQHLYLAQAKSFYDKYSNELESEEKKALEDFIGIFEQKFKISRMIGLLKGNYLKSDFIRVLGQLWFV